MSNLSLYQIKRSSLFITATLASVFIFLHANPVSAATRHVPSQYPSIQAAINSAQNGDVIKIANGVYRENIDITNKYVTISGNPDKQSVVLAGNAGRTPVMIQNVPYVNGAKAVITGLKITGGNAPDGQGGGITIANNADPEIYNNTIEDNYSVAHGGGILVFNNSNPLIRDNVIRKNRAKFFGGGIFVVRNSSPTITNNTITENIVAGGSIVNGGSSGGGIYLENITSNPQLRSNPVVTNNTISHNNAEFAGGGIMLRVGVNAIIDGNTLNSNSAAYGGGIHVETGGSSPIISNNTISNNTSPEKGAFPGSGFGGGISVYDKSRPTITANNIHSNQSTKGGAGIVLAENSVSTINRNTIRNNAVTGGGTVQGGGIYISNAQATVTNNEFYDNSAYLGGGIAAIGQNAKITLNHNTIGYNNAAHSEGGGGIFINSNSGTVVNITNNIITDNQKYQIFEQINGSNVNHVPHAFLRNNVITNTGSGLHFNYITNGVNSAASLDAASSVDADGTVDNSPSFANSGARNFALQSGSSGIDIATGSLSEDKTLIIRNEGNPDAGAYEYTDTPVTKQTVYRFWSTKDRSHFYTISKSERNTVLKSYLPYEWRYENVAYEAFNTQIAGTVPLYRFYSTAHGGHFYTTSAGERNSLISNPTTSKWKYENVAFYVYPSGSVEPSKNVYRFWSPTYRHHFYTASASEKNHVSSSYPSSIWTYEGERFKVPQ